MQPEKIISIYVYLPKNSLYPFQTNFFLSKQHEVKITQFYGIYDVSRKFKQAKSIKDFSGTKEKKSFQLN